MTNKTKAKAIAFDCLDSKNGYCTGSLLVNILLCLDWLRGRWIKRASLTHDNSNDIYYRSGVPKKSSSASLSLDQWLVLSFNRNTDTISFYKDFTMLGKQTGAFDDFTINYLGGQGNSQFFFEGGFYCNGVHYKIYSHTL